MVIRVNLYVHLLINIVKKLSHLVKEILATYNITSIAIVRPTWWYIVEWWSWGLSYFIKVKKGCLLFHIQLFINYTSMILVGLIFFNKDQELNYNVNLFCLYHWLWSLLFSIRINRSFLTLIFSIQFRICFVYWSVLISPKHFD